MGIGCDGSDITAVGVMEALATWLRNPTGREARVAMLESLEEVPDEYLGLLKNGCILKLFKELMKEKLRNKVLLDVAPKGRTKDVFRASEEARELREVLPGDMVIPDELLQRMVDTIKSKYLHSAFCSGSQKKHEE